MGKLTMIWIARSEKDRDNAASKKRLRVASAHRQLTQILRLNRLPAITPQLPLHDPGNEQVYVCYARLIISGAQRDQRRGK
jgi:hypothetical protein